MSNVSGLPDPTAETAVANVMREAKKSRDKATRFLPKELHKGLKVMRDLCNLLGYDMTDVRFRSREDGKEFAWTEWK